MPLQTDHPSFLSPIYVPPSYPMPDNWNKILLIGEAPGASEESLRTPFVGSSGVLLNKILLTAGLERERIALSNVINYRPVNNDFSPLYLSEKVGNKKITKAHPFLTQSIEQLHEEIKDHAPLVVVPVGNEALYAIMHEKGITTRRASCYPPTSSRPYWVVPLLHPSAVLHSAQWQEIIFMQLSLSRAKYLSEHPKYTPRPYSLSTLSSEEAIDLFSFVIPQSYLWSLDLEGDPSAHSIHCIGVAYQLPNDPLTYSACIPFPSKEVYQALQVLLTNRGDKLVNQNIAFDLNWLQEDKGVISPTPYMDVMHAFHLLYPEFPKRLGTICTWWFGLDIPYYKDERKVVKKKMSPSDLERYYAYNQLDCIVALWAAQQAEKELKERNLHSAYFSHHKKLWGIAQKLTSNGIHTDHIQTTLLKSIITQEASKASSQITTAMISPSNPEPNPGSIKQLREWLKSNKVKIPTNREGKESTDELAITELISKYPSLTPLHSLLIYRKLSKTVSTFLNQIIAKPVMHCSWAPDNTETFRFTSSEYLFREGLNLQTIPKELRYLFKPTSPYPFFLSADLSQAEARYVAHRSNCSYLLELFNDPSRSVHMERAKDIFGKPVEKDSPEYVMAKASLHAGNYRMGPRLFSSQSAIPYPTALKIMDAAHRKAPEIKAWHEEVKRTVKQKGVISNCFGQTRTCYTAIGAYLATYDLPENEWKELIAWEPQSAIPYQINLFLIWFSQEYPNYPLHHHGHDSFLASIPSSFITPENHKKLSNKLMTPFPKIGRSDTPLIIPTTLEIGLNWGEMIEWFVEDTPDEIIQRWKKKYEKERDYSKILSSLCYVPGLPTYEFNKEQVDE